MPYHNIPKDGHRSDVHATIHREQLSNDAIYIAYNDTRSNLASGNCSECIYIRQEMEFPFASI